MELHIFSFVSLGFAFVSLLSFISVRGRAHGKMAATSSNLKEELNCSICLDVYKDPVILDCGHNFCRECIEKAWETSDSDGTYNCPECRAQFSQKHELKQNLKLRNVVESFLEQCKPTVEGMEIFCDSCLEDPLPAVKTCIVCEASLCEQHLKKHNERPAQRNHSLVDPTSSLKERKCPAHDKMIEYYCSDDGALICVTCYVAGLHKTHNIKTLKDAYHEKQKSLSTVIEKLLRRDTELSKDLEYLKMDEEKLKKNNSSLEMQLSDLFGKILSHIKQTEEELCEFISSDVKALHLQLQDEIQGTEEKKTASEQHLKATQQLLEQSDAFLFFKDLKVSEEW
ncbi:E3 ubiquitin-protein ligase TRIM8-like [Protopterus annectens]|uniref:E3 ubiquitin-protein ligase TRIM8-like n=1 Tax=Protopterus annectens TaxID=7888 RepID=UPI001CF9F3BA|nr:E3 ubiquitin-protein ligase TRIM8-like [Protopterus annectens]